MFTIVNVVYRVIVTRINAQFVRRANKISLHFFFIKRVIKYLLM